MKDDIKKLKQEHAHLTIISQIAVQMLSLNTLDQVLWFLAQDVVSKLGFDDVVIYTFDKDQQKLIQGAAFGSKSDDNKRIIAPKTLSLGEGVVGKAALEKSPIIVNDTRKSDYYVVDNISRLSEIAVPMVIDNQLVGVIDSENEVTDFYTQQHLETLKAIALIAGTKIVKTLSSTELQKSLEKLEYSSRIQDALFDIAELIFETETMDEFYHRLHQEISKLIYAKNFMIALLTPDKKGIEFPFCIDEVDGYADISVVPFDRDKPSVTGYVMNTQKPLMVTDKQLNKMVNDKKVFVYGSVPKCWLGVPLINKSEFEGALIVQNYFDDYIFDENDKQLLVFAAKHITNAIERMQAREELKFQALHDSLTQLPNRLLFNDRTKQAIRNINRNTHHLVAVMFLDLDKFKLVNDTYGHQIGDQLLIEVSIAINRCLRTSDTLCRLSGDEFAILMEDLTSKEQAIKIADRIIKQVQLPIIIDDKTITTSTSIGVAIYDPKYSAEELIKYADQAMYIAKSSGRNQYCLFDATHVQLSKNEHYEQELKTAIEHGQFELEFQPLIDFNSLEIIGAEAFVRWHHPVKGLILPNEFLKSAKKFGLVTQVDTVVIEKVIAFLKQCKDLIPNRFVFGINMAGPSLHSEQVMGVIASHYQQNPYLLNHLCFEITEQFYVENFDKVKKHINQLRAMDAKISLDDFGSGYSSLNYLDKFSFDSIKIDQSFIGDLAPDKETSIILTTIINLAKSLDINIVAEGIETEYQFQTMQSLTCDVAQGFYIAKPMNKEMIIQLIKDKSKMKDIIRQQFK